MLNVTLVPILEDNYAYIIQSGERCAVIDPGEAKPIITALEESGLSPQVVLNTHHHGDHVAGNQNIKRNYACKVIGPEKDRDRIPGMDIGINDKDTFSFGDEKMEVIETPGHTAHHLCLYFPNSQVLFSGDTLFSMGCGRLFEGTAEQMFQSFEKFKSLPDETKIYCGHEYTLDNGKFCLSIEPDNPDLIERIKEVESLRSDHKPTIPSTIGLEKKTNVFMRAETPEEFKKYRELKDQF